MKKNFRVDKTGGKLAVVLVRKFYVHLLILHLAVVATLCYACFIAFLVLTQDSPGRVVPGLVLLAAYLLVLLFLLGRLRKLARIVLKGQVFTFDRLTDCLQRSGEMLCALRSIGSLRIRYGGRRSIYNLLGVSMDGPRYEIVFWQNLEDVSRLAKEIADYVGVKN